MYHLSASENVTSVREFWIYGKYVCEQYPVTLPCLPSVILPRTATRKQPIKWVQRLIAKILIKRNKLARVFILNGIAAGWQHLRLLCGLWESVCFSCFKPAGRSKGMYFTTGWLSFAKMCWYLVCLFWKCRVCYRQVSHSQSYASSVSQSYRTCTRNWFRRRCRYEPCRTESQKQR